MMDMQLRHEYDEPARRALLWLGRKLLERAMRTEQDLNQKGNAEICQEAPAPTPEAEGCKDEGTL